jgi:predicted nucleic acid-binding protein
VSVIAVDASVLVAASADAGPDGIWAESIVQQHVLIAPQHALVEATNVLRRLERKNRLTAREADEARRSLISLALELFPFEPFADRVWELRGKWTSYDAWYVALAEALQVPLATLDRRLTRTTGLTCRFLIPG